MSRDEIDALWTEALAATFEHGEVSARYRFAALVEASVRDACSKTRAGKPRELAPCGTGAFLDDQQFCFSKGWREGAASVRKAIRARGQS